MRRTLAALITVLLLVAALLIGRRQPDPARPASAASASGAADACIDRMFAAAERGDVETYLDCFTGPERDLLERQLADQPREQFASSLANSTLALKGRVIFVEPQTDAADEAALTVERIYTERIERQRYRLVRQRGGVWRIHSVEPAVASQPSVPYGTPVWQPPPED